ncbi:TPA: hypothetical protein VAK58_001404 [Klebsiella aerogenes]|nr:hypothetical protein [Klebsiella aerogenes]
MKAAIDFFGVLLVAGAYEWMRTNVPASRLAAWVAAAVVLIAWIFMRIVGEVLFEVLIGGGR